MVKSPRTRAGWLVAILIGASAGCAYTKVGPEQHISRSLELLTRDRVEGAYQQLLADSPLIRDSPQAVDRLTRETADAISKWGPPLGIEHLFSRRLGTSLLHVAYLVKLEQHPVLLEFYYYRAPRGWLLRRMTFNDEFWRTEGCVEHDNE